MELQLTIINLTFDIVIGFSHDMLTCQKKHFYEVILNYDDHDLQSYCPRHGLNYKVMTLGYKEKWQKKKFNK